jgi:hypothetical protein
MSNTCDKYACPIRLFHFYQKQWQQQQPYILGAANERRKFST